MKHPYQTKLAALVLLSSLVAAGCSNANSTDSAADASGGTAVNASANTAAAVAKLAGLKLADVVKYDDDDISAAWDAASSTAVKLSGASASVDGSGAAADGGTVTITAAGTYVLSGKLEGGVVVDSKDDGIVHIVLNGAEIVNASGPAIYVKAAGKTVLTLQEGTENAAADGEKYADSYTTADDTPTAAIYSKDDLTVNGTGKLSVTALNNDGITSKDDLKIVSGTIAVESKDDGLVGKDLAAVKDGSITVKAGGDGIKSTNDTDADKGYVAIAGGTFSIVSENDGIQAASSLVIEGGSFEVATGGGSANAEPHQQEGPPQWGGQQGQGGTMPEDPNGTQQGQSGDASARTPSATESGTTEAAGTESASAKGLKASTGISVAGGVFKLDSADDGVHSNGAVAIAGGDFSIATGDDGIHADASLAISGGKINITGSYEGLESASIAISDGEIHIVASDDGVNASEGSSESMEAGQGGGGMGGPGEAAGNALLAISGGYMTVDAAGDGLDSNGSITMSGGTVLVNGPTMDGNGALDYDGTFEQSGGLLIAAGSSGMAQAPSETSSQRAVLMTFPAQVQAGTLVTLADSAGKSVATFAPAKAIQSIVISAPELKAGESYTISTGGSSDAAQKDGLYESGAYSGGTKVVSFTLGDKVTYVNESGVTTAPSGFGGGGGGRGPGGGGGKGFGGGGRGQAPGQGQDGQPPAQGDGPGSTAPGDSAAPGTGGQSDSGASANSGDSASS